MNAPATFQRFMEHCLGDYRDKFAIRYLMIFLSFQRHLKNTLTTSSLCSRDSRSMELNFKPSKCNFFKREVSYLGRLISAKGFTMDPRSTEALTLKIRKRPANISELRRLLGLIDYFQMSIPNFSQTVKALYQLLKEKNI